MRKEPVVVSYPAFSSQLVTLETVAFDHYCGVPLSTTYGTGDFTKPTTVLYYTERTQNYRGQPIAGIDKYIKMTGDFATAVLRVRPHEVEPERFKKILGEIQQVDLKTLSAFQNKPVPAAEPVTFPKYGNNMGTFTGNYLEVLQFTANYTSFDPNDKLDFELLTALAKVGVVPGQTYDPAQVADIDPERIKPIVQATVKWARENRNQYLFEMFKPKGHISLEAMLAPSAIAPVGQPAEVAIYPLMKTADGKPMMADKHYVVRMSKEQLPPAQAFWSTTLYDAKEFLFIPNDRKKYAVGANAGMQLDDKGGIEVHIARTQPAGVPAANWIPSGEADQEVSMRMRIYHPDLAKMKSWTVPLIEEVKP